MPSSAHPVSVPECHACGFSPGTKKLTNKATLWYVPLSLKNVDKVLEVPPVVVRRPPPRLFSRVQRAEAGSCSVVKVTDSFSQGGSQEAAGSEDVVWGVLSACFIHSFYSRELGPPGCGA